MLSEDNSEKAIIRHMLSKNIFFIDMLGENNWGKVTIRHVLLRNFFFIDHEH